MNKDVNTGVFDNYCDGDNLVNPSTYAHDTNTKMLQKAEGHIMASYSSAQGNKGYKEIYAQSVALGSGARSNPVNLYTHPVYDSIARKQYLYGYLACTVSWGLAIYNNSPVPPVDAPTNCTSTVPSSYAPFGSK